MKTNRIRSKSGVSLVEVMIAMFVLSIGLMGIMQGFYYAQRMTDKTVAEYSTLKAGQHYLNILKQQDFNNIDLNEGIMQIPNMQGEMVTLQLNQENVMSALDMYDTSDNAADDIEMRITPTVTEISDELGNYYHVELAYAWKPVGGNDDSWVQGKLTTNRAKASSYIATNPLGVSVYNPVTQVKTIKQVITYSSSPGGIAGGFQPVYRTDPETGERRVIGHRTIVGYKTYPRPMQSRSTKEVITNHTRNFN